MPFVKEDGRALVELATSYPLWRGLDYLPIVTIYRLAYID